MALPYCFLLIRSNLLLIPMWVQVPSPWWWCWWLVVVLVRGAGLDVAVDIPSSSRILEAPWSPRASFMKPIIGIIPSQVPVKSLSV